MADTSDKTGLDDSRDALREPPADSAIEYYAVKLTGDAGGAMSITYYSHWVGWHDDKRRVELRQASLVHALYAHGMEQIGIPTIFVLTDADLMLWLVIGGSALVEKDLAESHFPELTQPFAAYSFGSSGFVDENILEPGSLSRAPTAKKRMAVFNRDLRRCRICGRSADDHVDVELNAHHIRPWEKGGVTDSSNLITLCQTCHKGLDPHFDPSLFNLVEQRDSVDLIERFEAAVADYRRTNPLRIDDM